ncbi:PepSY domain-containing protein [Pseudomonas sp. RIT-PI-S]|uniref:PepSY domain-containing protein n=1 Tax=Pseudomonas sp. RIT-PI-S TaxID=3035295 RepID=UPI0021D9677C|nr:PepSY domain-containing protein [Pseudomonas sp. RIT-PI-S]
MSGVRAVCLLMALIPWGGATAHDLSQDEALRLRQQGVILPLDQLTAKAIARYPGAVLLEAELEQEHGRYVYEIEVLLPSGQVRELEFDAVKGDLLEDKEDD